ncbi:TPA: flavodoxin family protein [Clostridium botulinum]|uniref:flavodoxin family protein n=1 Tax=Clostridium botulinum TaxID=1491 RepID=UPI000D0CA02B|nr:flavodoxin family protein [Clostridium botulinum]PSM03229.1 flavodoxin family protein [Clostridium botulinum]HDK7137695.1 flavodoxin family protein [Clostridium botulinum]HDK7142543.1 flavodoxin family protein [Clostridium botulinum]HDK7145953.1 flavodoxin family protein [Clostridium botulinum]HDK7149659.1 flavodoxin family protein [Clostridium botulinum]
MKVLILTGSPHPHGTTAFLADEFCIGAKEAGHEVARFDTAKLEIHPCIGCYYCRKNDGRCVYDDDMSQIYPHLMTADAVVLVTPLYYFSMTAQLKRTIDRFFAVNPVLRNTPKKLYLISAGNDKDDWAMDTLKANFHDLCHYLHWQEGGMVLALGANSIKDVENSEYQAMVRSLGAGI